MQIKHLHLAEPDADVFITNSSDTFAKFASTKIFNKIKQSCKKNQLIGLSGGSTPFPVYKRLAEMASGNNFLDKSFWFQVDERLTKDESRCNQKKIIEAMFSNNSGLQKEALLAINLNDKKDNVGKAYSNMFNLLPSEVRTPEPIDLLVMGLGADGHTASLFPECDWKLNNTGTDFIVFTPQTQSESRISLKLQRIIEAKEIIFLINAKGKEEALEEIFKLNNYLKPAGYVAKSRHTNWIINTKDGHDWIDSNKIEYETMVPLQEKNK